MTEYDVAKQDAELALEIAKNVCKTLREERDQIMNKYIEAVKSAAHWEAIALSAQTELEGKTNVCDLLRADRDKLVDILVKERKELQLQTTELVHRTKVNDILLKASHPTLASSLLDCRERRRYY